MLSCSKRQLDVFSHEEMNTNHLLYFYFYPRTVTLMTACDVDEEGGLVSRQGTTNCAVCAQYQLDFYSCFEANTW